MKKLTYIHLGLAIFAAVFINITTQIQLPIFDVFRPVKDVLSEYIGKKDGVQKLETAIDIYTKHKQINKQIPQEEASVVEALMKMCRQKKTLFDMPDLKNSCTPSDLKSVLVLILENSEKIPVVG